MVQDAKLKGVDFKLHIVGFGLKEGEKKELQCAAQAGNGKYYDASDANALSSVLEEATHQTVDQPAGNFSVYAVKNGQPVDAWVKVKEVSTAKDAGGARSYRDTAFVYLPKGNYEAEVKPLENSDVSATRISVEIKEEGQKVHRDIRFDSGVIKATALNNGEGWDATVRAVLAGTNTYAAGSRTYGRSVELEVNPGRYDVTIKILQVKGMAIEKVFRNVDVQPGETVALEHPFKSGIARIGVKTAAGELIDATVNFKETNSGTNVAGSRTYTSDSSNPREFILSPGTYEVKILTLGAHKGHSDTFHHHGQSRRNHRKNNDLLR